MSDAPTSNSRSTGASVWQVRDVHMDVKNLVAQFLLQNLKADGTVLHGAQQEAADKWKISKIIVKRIWQETKRQAAQGTPISFKSTKLGVPKVTAFKLDTKRVEALPLQQRTSIRKMANKLDMSKSTLHRCIQNKELRAHTNAIKLILSDANKIARLKFCLSNLVQDPTAETLKFQTMHNIVHIDEKWFYISNVSNIYYLLPNEPEPYRTCQNKRFITKVMFLCVVARSRFSALGETEFDGKICLYPFTTQLPAMRNSKNRPKGTMETKPLQNVSRAVIKECLINQVIPAMKEKWPLNCSKDIVIQQDNAKPHLQFEDKEFTDVASSDGFNIKLLCQPANSPDVNINDLGWFRSLQSLKDEKVAKSVDELVENVMNSYEELNAETLNKVFLSLQSCFIDIIKDKGGNNFKGAHLNKNRLTRLGQLPISLEVEHGIVKEALEYLFQKDMEMGSMYDFQAIRRAFGF